MTHFNCEGGVPDNVNGWMPIGLDYPVYDKPILVTDGSLIKIMTLRSSSRMRYWECDSLDNENFMVRFWMPLPNLPNG